MMVALWMPMKPLPSSRTNDSRSAFCESSMSRSPSVKNTTASKAFEVLGAPLQGLLGDGGAVGPEIGVPLAPSFAPGCRAWPWRWRPNRADTPCSGR